MKPNPYKYHGPLDPVNENGRLVCIDRNEAVVQVITGIMRGDYWSILGPRQIGKTTFLRQITMSSAETNSYCLHIDFQLIPSNEESFYQWLANKLVNQIPSEQKISGSLSEDNRDSSPALRFFNFLQNFKPKKKKVILMFDEIDEIPFLRTFLHLWRKVFHERNYKEELKNYAVIVTGSTELIKLTLGPNSPFNIAEILYIQDFSDEESKKLIEGPFNDLKITIELKAKEKLISLISGHPQMLQHACHILVDKATQSGESITGNDVEDAVKQLLEKNSSIRTLDENIKNDNELRQLLKDILNGKEIKFRPNRQFSLLGAGAIKNKNSLCVIRNEVYRKFIEDALPDTTETNVESSTELQNPVFGISLVLAILLGFVSIMTSFREGMFAAGVFALVAFISLIAPIFKRKKKKKTETEEHEPTEQ